MSDQWRDFDFAVASGRLQQLEQEFFPRLKLKFQRFFCRAVNRPEFFNARFLVQFMNQVKVDYISLEEFGGANMLFSKSIWHLMHESHFFKLSFPTLVRCPRLP